MHVLRQADQILELGVLVEVVLLTCSNRGSSVVLETSHCRVQLLVERASFVPYLGLNVSERVNQLDCTLLDRCAINCEPFTVSAGSRQVV